MCVYQEILNQFYFLRVFHFFLYKQVWPKLNMSLKEFVILTLLKPLNRMSGNLVINYYPDLVIPEDFDSKFIP